MKPTILHSNHISRNDSGKNVVITWYVFILLQDFQGLLQLCHVGFLQCQVLGSQLHPFQSAKINTDCKTDRPQSEICKPTLRKTIQMSSNQHITTSPQTPQYSLLYKIRIRDVHQQPALNTRLTIVFNTQQCNEDRVAFSQTSQLHIFSTQCYDW